VETIFCGFLTLCSFIHAKQAYFDGVKGRNGSFHVNVGLGGLETHAVLAVRLQAANPATEKNT
jgi:hypothetical protein